MKKMPVSFSRLNTFEQCGRKFEYLYVLKSVQDLGSVHTEYGTRVHEGLENYAKALLSEEPVVADAIVALEGKHSEAAKHFPLVAKLVAKPGDKYFEHQMSLNGDKEPCDWFADDVWLRGIADVLVVDGDTAYVFDWKTGKVKDDPSQMQVFALLTMIHFPQVQIVKTCFVWLAHDQTTSATYTRRMLPHLWTALGPRFDRLQDAVELGVFKATPSPLCKWCAAKDICPDARKR